MLAAVAAIGVLAPIPAALAKNPRDVAKSARCSAGSIAKLKLSPENGRIEVEFEVDQNRNGVPWRWALARPGTTLRSGAAVTRAPSGSFSVRKLVANRPGPDRLTVRASRAGEVCTVTATL
jgi:hypothetical protein